MKETISVWAWIVVLLFGPFLTVVAAGCVIEGLEVEEDEKGIYVNGIGDDLDPGDVPMPLYECWSSLNLKTDKVESKCQCVSKRDCDALDRSGNCDGLVSRQRSPGGSLEHGTCDWRHGMNAGCPYRWGCVY